METTYRKFVQHNGKTVILHDYRGLEGTAYVDAIEYNGQRGNEMNMPGRLILIDVTNSVINKEVVKAFKRVSKGASGTVSKTAVVGVRGIQELFLKAVCAVSNLEIKPFDNREDATEWLTN